MIPHPRIPCARCRSRRVVGGGGEQIRTPVLHSSAEVDVVVFREEVEEEDAMSKLSSIGQRANRNMRGRCRLSFFQKNERQSCGGG